jgi:hypothetical protein
LNPYPLALSLSKGWLNGTQGFDKLSPNEWKSSTTLESLPVRPEVSKGWLNGTQGFDKLSPNGA